MKYASDYRNRPIKTLEQHERDEKLKKQKGCYCRMGCGSIILIGALLYGGYKINKDYQAQKINEVKQHYEFVIDSLEHKIEELKNGN